VEHPEGKLSSICKWVAVRKKPFFDAIGLQSRGIQPKPETRPRLTEIFRVRIDECAFIGQTPIARVQDYSISAAQLIRGERGVRLRANVAGEGCSAVPHAFSNASCR
jgi:hypothetical protein